jgi:hypothetical protein
MRPFLAQFSEPVWSGHVPSWADFITTTSVFRFWVHTTGFYSGEALYGGRDMGTVEAALASGLETARAILRG